jgi:hypothetical protein
MALRATHGDECQRVTFERAVVLFLSPDCKGAVASHRIMPTRLKRSARFLFRVQLATFWKQANRRTSSVGASGWMRSSGTGWPRLNRTGTTPAHTGSA